MRLLTLVFGCFLFLSACQSTPVKASPHDPYPEEWWTPVPRDQAASWEILPQDAQPGEVILSKRNELGILSNFAATPFVLDGVSYASVEGFWQMLKYPENARDERATRYSKPWPFTRDQVGQMTAFEAKHAGSLANAIMHELGIDWVTYKGTRIQLYDQPRGDFYKLIVRAEQAKLDQNPEVKRILIKTGNLILKPDHHQDPNELPAWKYNQVWMDLRAAL